MDKPAKPLPIVTPIDKRYWRYTKQHQLRLQCCNACRTFRFPPSPVCAECGSERTDWVAVSGKGTIFSWVIFHKSYFPGFAAELPYNVAMIQLDEGPMFIANIVDIENSALRKGLHVAVTFEEISDEFTIPKFRVVDGEVPAAS